MDTKLNKNPKEFGSPKKPIGGKNSANQLAGMIASGQPTTKRTVAHEAGRNQAPGFTAAAETPSSSCGRVAVQQPSVPKDIGVRQQTVVDVSAATNPNAPKTTFVEPKSAAKVLQNLHDYPEQEMTSAKQVSIE